MEQKVPSMPQLMAEERDSAMQYIELDHKNIKLLGEGGYGSVYAAETKLGEIPIAIKVVKLEGKNDGKHKLIEREIHMLRKCIHPNILEISNAFQRENFFFIFTELCDEHNLEYYIRKGFEEKEGLQVILDILGGVKHMHKNGFVHRDLKPSNILVQTNKDGKRTYKLGDFGLAKPTDSGVTSQQIDGIKGTYSYAAPEWMQSNQYKTEVRNLPQGDCWSLGVIIYYMIEGHLPFGGEHIYLQVTHYDYAPLSEKNKTWDYFFSNIFCEMNQRWNIYEIEKHIRLLKEPVILSKSQLPTKEGTPSSNFSTQMTNTHHFPQRRSEVEVIPTSMAIPRIGLGQGEIEVFYQEEVNAFLKEYPEAKEIMEFGERLNFDLHNNPNINEKDLEMCNHCKINKKGEIYTGYWNKTTNLQEGKGILYIPGKKLTEGYFKDGWLVGYAMVKEKDGDCYMIWNQGMRSILMEERKYDIGKQIDEEVKEGGIFTLGKKLTEERKEGGIYIAKREPEKDIVAIKEFSTGLQLKGKHWTIFDKEVTKMREIDSPNIIKLLDEPFITDKKTCHLAMEYCNGGNLKQYVDKYKGYIPMSKISDIMRQVIEGMSYMDKRYKLLREINLEDILLHKEGMEKDYTYKIGYLGFTQACVEQTGELFGLSCYSSPQVLNNEPYTKKAVVYGFGIMLYYLAYKENPFGSIGLYKELLVEQKDMKFPETRGRTAIYQDLVSKCLKYSEESRLDIEGVRNHPFIGIEEVKGESIMLID